MGKANSVMTESPGANLKQIPECLLRALVQKKAATTADLDGVLRGTLRTVADWVEAQGIALFLVSHTVSRLQIHIVHFSSLAHGRDEAKAKIFAEKAEHLEKMILPISEETMAGQAILRAEPRVIYNVAEEKQFYDPIEWAPEFVIRTLLAVPLKHGDRVIGCVEALNKCPDRQKAIPFTEADVKLIQDVTYYLTKVIRRSVDPALGLNERELARAQAHLSKCEFVELQDHFQADLALLTMIGAEKLTRYSILPLGKTGDQSIRAVVANPADYQNITDFELVTGLKITEKSVAPASEIRAALHRLLPEGSQVSQAAESIVKEFPSGDGAAVVTVQVDGEDENSTPVVKLANRIIEDAHTQGASDIHIEPFENKILVRYRIDGVCRVKLTLPKQAHRSLVSRIKIMSDLDIAEHRLPQDGRIIFHKFSAGHDIDLRVSISPMIDGESVVMRILDKGKSMLPLNQLGFSEYNLARYRTVIQAPYGMILHVGPTGSGKSMTLFAALNEINSPEWKIITAEDPIEYTLGGISQLQVHDDIGLTFAAALRCFLRQDPDIILVGEIRDRETAEIATEAALTGHLIFSTLHTNDAGSAVTRLTDLGVEPFLISTTLECVCAQRLLRRLCRCKRPRKPDAEQSELLKRAKGASAIDAIFELGGCDDCDNSGYKGRVGIHELLVMNDELRDMTARGSATQQVKQAARRNGMHTLFEDAMEKVKAGVTSLPEALATARQDESAV